MMTVKCERDATRRPRRAAARRRRVTLYNSRRACVEGGSIASSSPLNAVGRINYRRWAGILGSLRMAQRAFSVYQKCGSGRGDENESADSDDTAIDAAAQAAIDESQWTFVAILASFL